MATALMSWCGTHVDTWPLKTERGASFDAPRQEPPEAENADEAAPSTRRSALHLAEAEAVAAGAAESVAAAVAVPAVVASLAGASLPQATAAAAKATVIATRIAIVFIG